MGFGALMPPPLCARPQWRERKQGPKKSRGEGRGGRGGRGGYAERGGFQGLGSLHGPRALQRGSLYGTDDEDGDRRRRDEPSDDESDDGDLRIKRVPRSPVALHLRCSAAAQSALEGGSREVEGRG